MIKKCMWVQCKALTNKDITIIKVASYMKYIDIKLVCPITYGRSKTNLVLDSILKWEIMKRCSKYIYIDIVNYVLRKNEP